MKPCKEREKELTLPLSTKFVILFDNDLIDNTYREYTLSEFVSGQLKLGKKVSVTFCHPDVAEEFTVKLEEEI
jgi:hypothetical protein